MISSRRTFLKQLGLTAGTAFFLPTHDFFADLAGVLPRSTPSAVAGQTLELRIGDGFGKASAADISAVLKSAGEALWKHCPNTRWEVPGFFIFHNEQYPITAFDHRSDGRIAIGLTTQGPFWSQFAYQFAHEFCHALAGHANDWQATWIKPKKANHWLEESLCETASLFAMRDMGKTWQTAPPYPNWKDYSKSLSEYATQRIEQVTKEKGDGFEFKKWFAENEAAMRENSTIREKNNIVALELLPVFEESPSGWEAVTFYNLGENRDAGKTLARHFADWSAAAPAGQREFIKKLAAVFGI
jgi:hypothetical protein